MSLSFAPWTGSSFVVHPMPGFVGISRSEFFAFCQLNGELRFERTAEGDVVIMTPAGGESGRRGLEVASQLKQWSDRDGTGIAFDSSTGFWLTNAALRSPDAAWVRRGRWEALSQKERDEFPPLAPDFVIEVRSKTDRLPELREKLQEYVDNGVRLGWLIDPTTRSVEVYRLGRSPEVLDNPSTVAADPELPGFVCQLTPIW